MSSEKPSPDSPHEIMIGAERADFSNVFSLEEAADERILQSVLRAIGIIDAERASKPNPPDAA